MSRIAVALVLLAALVRLGFVLATPGYLPRGDDGDYLRLGTAIARTGGYPVGRVWTRTRGCPAVRDLPRAPCVAAPGAPGARLVPRPTAYRPPAYPYALAAPALLARWWRTDPLPLARVLQALLGTVDAALVGLLAGLLWGRRTGLIALGLSAVYVPFVLVSDTLISEPLYVAFMLGAVCAALRFRVRPAAPTLALAGVLSGLSALTRSNGVLVAVAVLVLVLGGDGAAGRRRRAVRGLILAAVAAATIAPWVVRDAVVFHRFVPISTEGGGTLLGTWNATSRANRAEPAAWLGLSHLAGYGLLYREQSAHPEPVIDTALRDDALKFAVAHPAYLGSVLFHNTVRLLDLDGFARVRFAAGTVDIPPGPAVLGAVVFYAVALLALFGIACGAARGAPREVWLLAALQCLSTVLVNTETPRFRTPLEPFLLMVAAGAVAGVSLPRPWRGSVRGG